MRQVDVGMHPTGPISPMVLLCGPDGAQRLLPGQPELLGMHGIAAVLFENERDEQFVKGLDVHGTLHFMVAPAANAQRGRPGLALSPQLYTFFAPSA
jgi:hypothetical protein